MQPGRNENRQFYRNDRSQPAVPAKAGEPPQPFSIAFGRAWLRSLVNKSMIPLDPSEWRQLGHAYGSAENIPALLNRLAEYPDESDYRNEPWFSLWSALCHQDDVYSASYAAVPHIVRLAECQPEKATRSHFVLPTAIEIHRVAGRGPALALDLEQEYLESLKRLGRLAAELLNRTVDEPRIRYLRGAVAIGQGDVASAARIIDPDQEEV